MPHLHEVMLPVPSPSDLVACLIPIRSCCLSHPHQILLPVSSISNSIAGLKSIKSYSLISFSGIMWTFWPAWFGVFFVLVLCERSDQMVSWFGFLVLCEQFWSDQMGNGLQTESPVPRFRPPSNVTFVLCVLQARGDRSARVAASQPPPCRWPSASSNLSTSAGCMSPPRSVAATIALNLPTVDVKLPAVAVKLSSSSC